MERERTFDGKLPQRGAKGAGGPPKMAEQRARGLGKSPPTSSVVAIGVKSRKTGRPSRGDGDQSIPPTFPEACYGSTIVHLRSLRASSNNQAPSPSPHAEQLCGSEAVAGAAPFGWPCCVSSPGVSRAAPPRSNRARPISRRTAVRPSSALLAHTAARECDSRAARSPTLPHTASGAIPSRNLRRSAFTRWRSLVKACWLRPFPRSSSFSF